MQELQTSSIADLTECDREPIQIPGSIQPHGVLLVLREPDFTIIQASASAQEIFGIAPDTLLNAPLEQLFDEAQMTSFKHELQGMALENNPLYLFTMHIKGQTRPFDGVAHRIDGLLVLELEIVPEVEAGQPDLNTSPVLFHSIQAAFAKLHSTSMVSSYGQMIAEQVRALTGFDRVLIYRFEEDGHGIVIAEDKRPELEPFLGLHYPASDIPQQARRLYTINWLRLIGDVSYRPSPLLPAINPVTGRTLDMSYAVLRSVSPVHLEYLKNMRVQSSMSISIVRDNALWGLIACHHMTPRFVPYGLRSTCEILGRIMSLQLPAIEAQEDAQAIAQRQQVQSQLIDLLSGEEAFSPSVTTHTPTILDLIPASGVAVCFDGETHLLGKTPGARATKEILDWILTQPEQDVFSTNSLAHYLPDALAWQKEVSGVVALLLSRTSREAILWFRPERVQTITWAGKPAKPVKVNGDKVRLSPRQSFEAWKQTVKGIALPWRMSELEAVRGFRNSLLRVVIRRAEELARLNAKLEQSNEQLDIFADIASHDLKEPLRGIHNFAHFLIEDYKEGTPLDAEGVAKLETLIVLTKRMKDLINSLLHYSRLGYTDLTLQEADLNEMVHEVLDVLRLRIEEGNIQIKIPHSLPTVACDPVSMSEVFYNLLSNAMKYNQNPDKWVEIGVLPREKPEQETPTLYIRDNGIGISPDHYETVFRMFRRLHARDEYGGGTGIGLAIVKRVVERHGGTIWLESEEGRGTTFYFRLSQGVHEEHGPTF
jgi:light-regulated signal transduction histidine kinase (bacteriophytochrome)